MNRSFASRWLAMATLAFMLALPMQAQAQYQYSVSGGKVTITNYTGSGGAVVIPASIAGMPVVSIGRYAFQNCAGLTGVVIPGSVTSIQEHAFHNCINLVGLAIPGSVTSIGDYAFVWCTSLVDVAIPASVATLGDFAFSWCTRLLKVYFRGNAPVLADGGSNLFHHTDNVIVYYLLGTTGWGATCGGRPTVSMAAFPDAYEFDGNAPSAKAISNGQTQNHTMHVAGDVDWVKFTIGAAGASNVRVETSGASGDTHMWLFGPNNAATLVGYDNDSGTGNFSLIAKAALAPGTYYLGIREYGDNATIAAYTVHARWTGAPDAYEFDGNAPAAKAIANGQTQNHSMHVAGDVDWVKFTVPSGGAANVRVETAGASGDTHMWLFGPNNAGTLVAYNDDKGGGNMFSLITAASLPPGTYYLGIREYGDNATIAAYTVKVSWTPQSMPSGDAYEYDGSATAAKAIANGQVQSRSIQPVGEVDWAKFTVSAPGAANVRIETSGAAGDTQMWLFGPNNASTLVDYNDDKGGGNYFSLITRASLAPGTYYIGIREYGNDAAIPAYTLQASWVGP